jgi:hypothetical protein
MGSTTVMVSPDFGGEDSKEVMDALAKKIGRVVASQLMQTGLQIVRDARSKVPDDNYREAINSLSYAKGETRAELSIDSPGFNDDTGNLRSSIGFVLTHNGETIKEDFEKSAAGTDKSTGVQTGKAYAKKVNGVQELGWTMTAVAGMEYAGWVEALGYDVLTGSTLGVGAKFQKDLEAALSNIDFKVIRNIDWNGLDTIQ